MTEAEAYQAGLRDGETIGYRKGVSFVVDAMLDRPLEIDPRALTAMDPFDKRGPMQELANMIARSDRLALQVLRPVDLADALTPRQAAGRAGVSVSCIRGWTDKFAIGRKVGGKLLISRAATDMLSDGDAVALGLYLMGDRISPLVSPYFARTDALA